MDIQIDPVPGLERVVHFLRAGVDRPLIRGLGFTQLPANHHGEGLQVLTILFLRRGGVLSSLLGLSKPRHTLHANNMQPSRTQEDKEDFPSARVHLRILRSMKEGQTTVPVCLVLRDIAPELPHQTAALSFDLPVGLRVVGRGIARGYTEQLNDALVIDRGRLPPVRKDRVADAIGSHSGVKER